MLFLDHKHADAVQRPMPGHDRRVAPPDKLVGDRFSIRGDESRGAGIGQHRGVRRDVGVAPLPQFQARGLDHGTVRLRKRDAWLERRDHRSFQFHRT
jgi:hypothetical protein